MIVEEVRVDGQVVGLVKYTEEMIKDKPSLMHDLFANVIATVTRSTISQLKYDHS